MKSCVEKAWQPGTREGQSAAASPPVVLVVNDRRSPASLRRKGIVKVCSAVPETSRRLEKQIEADLPGSAPKITPQSKQQELDSITISASTFPMPFLSCELGQAPRVGSAATAAVTTWNSVHSPPPVPGA